MVGQPSAVTITLSMRSKEDADKFRQFIRDMDYDYPAQWVRHHYQTDLLAHAAKHGAVP